MNNYNHMQQRKRAQSLFIVEGNHEKDELLNLLLQCFPEMNIDLENVIIYGTNIYNLYSKIVEEYGTEWDEIDVDLPYVVSKLRGLEEVWYKDNFINIFLIFDYERQDTYFSEKVIMKLQKYFTDETDTGKLYINYPMVESYWDSFDSEESTFRDKKISFPYQTGDLYKNQTKHSSIAKAVMFPGRLDDILDTEYGICNKEVRKDCIDRILALTNDDDVIDSIEKILSDNIAPSTLRTARFFIHSKVQEIGYTKQRVTYIEFMRRMLCNIMHLSISKANMIQNGGYDVEKQNEKNIMYNLDFSAILNEQNRCSRNPDHGFVWILNTSVLIVPNYSFRLIC